MVAPPAVELSKNCVLPSWLVMVALLAVEVFEKSTKKKLLEVLKPVTLALPALEEPEKKILPTPPIVALPAVEVSPNCIEELSAPLRNALPAVELSKNSSAPTQALRRCVVHRLR